MKPTYEELEHRVDELLKCCDAMATVNAAFVKELEALRPRPRIRGYALDTDPND